MGTFLPAFLAGVIFDVVSNALVVLTVAVVSGIVGSCWDSFLGRVGECDGRLDLFSAGRKENEWQEKETK